MAVTITGVANSVVSPRSLQATSTGRLWVAAGDATANTIEFWYSDDAGVTWTENTAAQITWDGANYFAFYIDADDHAHRIRRDSHRRAEVPAQQVDLHDLRVVGCVDSGQHHGDRLPVG